MSKELVCSKRPESLELHKQFQSLQLREDILGVKKHCEILNNLFTEFSKERKNLRWLEKLISECDQWGQVIHSVIRAQSVEEDVVLIALVRGEILIDEAIEML
jgi:hypothetical protein